MPGQRMPIGTHILVELKDRHGHLYIQEGTISAIEFAMPNWEMVDEFGTHALITRYKLRSVADDTETEQEARNLVEA